ncbi:MAG: peptide chain release factor N(5)-glutamine methyltransferase, partial [Gemmatimonadales bacterium]
VILWTELTGEDAAELVIHPDRPADPALAAAFHDAVARRSRGEPLAHIIGRIGFPRLTLRSDRRALIPRPETEGLVDLLLSRVSSGRVADVGTGSGCLALSLATEGGFTHVAGVDLSAEALELARENRGLADARVDLVQADLCAPLGRDALDALVSNPPYLTAAEYAGLDGAVRRWEPALALESGVDGLDATSRLLDEGRAVLRSGGWLAVEVDCTRATETARRAAGLGWSDVAIHADLFGRERYLLARRNR